MHLNRRTLLLGGATIACGTACSISTAAGHERLGFDIGGMDRRIRPGDDFAAYANGGWLRETEIPADEGFFGIITQLDALSRERTRTIIERATATRAPAGSETRKVGDFHASFMDEAVIEARGVAPLLADLEPFRTAPDRTAFATALGGVVPGSGPSLFPLFIAPDSKAPDRHAAYLMQGGIGLPDRDYYLDPAQRFATIRDRYPGHIRAMLALTGMAAGDADVAAGRIIAFERRIAEVHWTRASSRDDEKTYNPWPVSDLERHAPGLPWRPYLEAAGLSRQARLIAAQPDAIAAIAAIFAETPLETLKDWATLHMARAAAAVLPAAFVREDFLFNGQAISGQQVIQDRWKRGVAMVTRSLGDAVGKLYVQAHFPPRAKVAMNRLVRDIIGAMDHRLEDRSWMAPETRRRARVKLARFTAKIGYPDRWRDYSDLLIERGDAYGNLKRARVFEHRRRLAALARPVDRGEWQMSPMTINAYAERSLNEIVFPAAILQPPFFDPDADPAINYGAIGAVIGHELSHHFDDQGRKYDPDGRLADWWTQADVEHFQRLADRVVAQYERYEPLPGHHVDGARTLGENIADIAGLALAHHAYLTSLRGRTPQIIGGFTGEQRFFLGYAQINRLKYRERNLERRLTTDPHVPGHIRPNAVRNLDAWYRAFDVRGDAKLHLPPEERIIIW